MTHKNANDKGSCSCSIGSSGAECASPTSVAEATATRENSGPARVFTPAVDVVETEQEFTVKADLPGAASDTIEINYEDGQLTIHAPVKGRVPQGGLRRHAEYGVGDFHRAFRIGEGIDSSRITAEFRDGVLTLRLPKSEAAKPRKIRVQAD